MNGIVALIPSDPRSAERMLTGLSDFLRLSLHNAGEQEVPIEREIQLLERYVMIQQLRFQDRLRISISVDPRRAARSCRTCCCSRSRKIRFVTGSVRAPVAEGSRFARTGMVTR